MSKERINRNEYIEFLDRYFLKNHGLYFIELSKLAKLPFEELPQECKDSFYAIEQWINNYLIKPHPLLGRSGPVCPFVKACVVKKSFYLSALYEEDILPDALVLKLQQWKQIFLDIEPKIGHNSIYRTLLILFPYLSNEYADKLFINVIKQCKTLFVKNGLMLGEFHSGPPEKHALHNQEFKPLYSPIPMLVIREMVSTDIEFLRSDTEHKQAYQNKFATLSSKSI